MQNQPSLLVRLLSTPNLATIVPRLQPDILHRLIQTCGLEDSGDFITLATPEQLGQILDLDVWHVRTSGADEEFDADRFGAWISVLMEAGPEIAAEKLEGLDIDLVVAGLSRHVTVFDGAAAASYTMLDGQEVAGRAAKSGHVAEIGGYLVEAKRTSAWDSIVDLLASLHASHAEFFHRVVRGCVAVSSGPSEEDGFHDLLAEDEQEMFDLASDREARRERQGYVTPAQAHAFLKGARELPLQGDRPAANAIANAYFRAFVLPPGTDVEPVASTAEADAGSASDGPSSSAESEAVAGFVEVLREAGVLAGPTAPLLAAAPERAPDLSWIQRHIESHPASADELAFLVNALIAGCSIQDRPLNSQEASNGAAATCNLGLENWPADWADADLITAFQVGWTILHREVCLYSAESLIQIVAGLQCEDRDTRLQLQGLRHALLQAVRDGQPWRARRALDVIITLDASSWAALLALIDECPVIHAALNASRQRRRSVSPTDFEFITGSSQIAAVREFMAALPSVLAG